MKTIALALPLILLTGAVATPAQATGGLVCRTGGDRPIEVSVGFGHVPGAPLIGTTLVVDGRSVPVSSPQWWLDRSEVRLMLIDPQALRQELLIKASRKGDVYEGSAWRDGEQRWIRCREG